MKYRIKKAGTNSMGYAAGTICYDVSKWDYGCSSDDTRHTGIEHVAVTLNADGDYPFFTVVKDDLEQVQDSDTQNPLYNPWHPISNPVDLKHLGKLAEEAAELCSAVSRCIIQGVDGTEPVTGKVNRQWLEEELADVAANAALVIERFNLNAKAMDDRINKKMIRLRQWHSMA